MLSNISFRPGAKVELREAYSWLEEREPGLGLDFIRCVDACLQLIRRHPQIYPVVYRDIRKALIRRFPYSIFYIPKEDTIIVFSVFHASREPKKWLRGKSNE